MSRPLKNDIDYFSHDTGMSSDEKIERLEYKFKNDGYAIYNKILEKVFRSEGKFNIESESDYEIYSSKWHVDFGRLKLIIEFMREIKLFPLENFLSRGVLKRIKKIKSERQRKRNYYKIKEDKDRVLDVQNIGETAEIANKENKRKVNKSKVNNTTNDFDRFWDLYNKKIGNKESLYKHWSKLKEDDRRLIFSTLPDYLDSTPDKKFRKNPQTYLNQKSWLDEIISTNGIHKTKTDLEPEKF